MSAGSYRTISRGDNKITPEMINCTGCREAGVKFSHCAECAIERLPDLRRVREAGELRTHAQHALICSRCAAESEIVELIVPALRYAPVRGPHCWDLRRRRPRYISGQHRSNSIKITMVTKFRILFPPGPPNTSHPSDHRARRDPGKYSRDP
jgi:hypothetical protein